MSLLEDTGFARWSPGDPMMCVIIVERPKQIMHTVYQPSLTDLREAARVNDLNAQVLLDTYTQVNGHQDCHTLFIDAEKFREANGPYVQEL